MHQTIAPSTVAEISPTYARAMSDINKAVLEYVETGIANIIDLDYSQFDQSDCSAKRAHWRKNRQTVSCPYHVRSFVKKIAKEMGRPIITAEHGGWGGSRVFVTIKKLKRNEVIVAPFLLFKVELHRRSKVDGPIVLFNDKTNHYLQFFGPKGIAAYHKWAEQCRADEAFRKAMKLDIAITHNLEK